jgi:hypothetical protein
MEAMIAFLIVPCTPLLANDPFERGIKDSIVVVTLVKA